jgi:hypothetical protein
LYDMYHWDKPADPTPARRRKAASAAADPSAARLPAPRDGSDPTGTDQAAEAARITEATGIAEAVGTDQATEATGITEATQAVQFALDRRDNGGDVVTAAGQPTARQTRQ